MDLISDYVGTLISTICGVFFVNKILKIELKLKKPYVLLFCMLNSLIITACCVFKIVELKSIVGYFYMLFYLGSHLSLINISHF